MNMLKKITSGGKLIAIIVSRDFQKDGIEFFTPKEFSQQLGYMKRPKGYKVNPHTHNVNVREIKYTQETIVVKSGRVQVDLYSCDRKYIGKEELKTGDIILLADGGHGLVFLEESELIEIKQGPYDSFVVDKERFENVSE